MSDDQSPIDYLFIIPDAARQRILLLDGDSGWQLPAWRTTERIFWQCCDQLNLVASARLGVTLTTLRCIALHYDDTTGRDLRIYELEVHEPGWSPPAPARWSAGHELGALPPEHARAASAWFVEQASGPTLGRPAWTRPGWLDAARQWIAAQLGRLGLSATGRPEQLRTWERGTVLRVPTTAGPLYFKAQPAMFRHEFGLLQLLSPAQPERLVRLLATDEQRGWILMAALAGQPLTASPDLSDWLAAVRELALLQQDATAHGPALLALGCPDQRLGALRAAIAPFFAALDQYPQLTTAEIGQLRQLAPSLAAMCGALEQLGPSASLEHGDLWASNIMVNQGQISLFDWSDCSISHPFLGLDLLCADAAQAFPAQPTVPRQLEQAYLAAWAGLIDPAAAQQALDLARRLTPLHHALHYHRHILPGMQQRWEMENMVPWLLRALLKQMER